MYQNTIPSKSLEYRRRLIAEDIHASDPHAAEKVAHADHHTDDKV